MIDETMRNTHLREILSGRRRELQDDVLHGIRDGLIDRPNDVRDELERSDANTSEDVELALLQMKAETLRRVEQALGRLDAGLYGCCSQCGVEIAETRLRALPFAVRCAACEDSREQGQARSRRAAHQHAAFPLFPEAFSS